MFVDRVKIHIKGGNGGNGAVSFFRAKYITHGGPDGGDVRAQRAAAHKGGHKIRRAGEIEIAGIAQRAHGRAGEQRQWGGFQSIANGYANGRAHHGGTGANDGGKRREERKKFNFGELAQDGANDQGREQSQRHRAHCIQKIALVSLFENGHRRAPPR